MRKLKAVFFCGHESRYGLAHIGPLLTSSVIEVVTVVLAPRERWEIFRSMLSGESSKAGVLKTLQFDSHLRRTLRRIKELSSCEIALRFDVNEIKDSYKGIALFISAAYPQIFSPELITLPIIGAINFHPSFLPRCRGAHPIYWTIASQEPFGGVSCHFMTEKLDDGPLLAQRKIEFDARNVTYPELYSMIEAETPLLVKDVEAFFRDGRDPFPQVGPISYYRNDRAIHRKINFGSESPDQISAKIRAGGAFCFDTRGRKLVMAPPVEFVHLPRHVTNGVEAVLINGTVVDVKGEIITIKSGSTFISAAFGLPSRSPARALQKVLNKAVLGRKEILQSPPRIGELLT